MRRRSLAAAGVVALVLSGCSSPDLTPVPTVADAPFVCEGVPRRGPELILGGDVVVARSDGPWGAERRTTRCVLERADGEPGSVMIIENAAGVGFGTRRGEEATLKSFSEGINATRIDREGPGGGYVAGTDRPVALWTCHERVLSVELINVSVEGRDDHADAENLLVSMLPWECDGAPVPEAGGDV